MVAMKVMIETNVTRPSHSLLIIIKKYQDKMVHLSVLTKALATILKKNDKISYNTLGAS